MFIRTLASFVGAMILLNVAGNLFTNHNANHWWLDLRPLADAAAQTILAVCAAAILVWGVAPHMSGWRRYGTVACAALMCILALMNSVWFYRALWRGQIHTIIPVPLSLVIAATFAIIGISAWRNRSVELDRRRAVMIGITLAMCVVAIPLAQIVFFGNTDYRRRADVAVVFGARAYADGRPSQALSDRVQGGCELYRSGLVNRLIFSGGPGDGAVHEVEAMRTQAIALGVPAGAIDLDYNGLNTSATVRNVRQMLGAERDPRILAVSHFYHLPRIKLEFERAGIPSVFTVPAPQHPVLQRLPTLMAREVVALWSYYLRGFI